jgi:hypothetical protein
MPSLTKWYRVTIDPMKLVYVPTQYRVCTKSVSTSGVHSVNHVLLSFLNTLKVYNGI